MTEINDFLEIQGPASSPVKEKLKTSSLRSRPGTKPSTRNNPKLNFSRHPNGHSVPTKDNGPRQGKTSLSWELIKLQNELKVYVQKVEEQACRGKTHKKPPQKDAFFNQRTFYVGLCWR